MAKLLIHCREAHALLSGRCDGALNWRQRLVLRIHLLGCDACGAVGRNFAFLSRAVHAMDRRQDR